MINPQTTSDEILSLIGAGRIPEAADKWHAQQKDGGFCRNACPYGEGRNATRCTHCLEGNIRTSVLKAVYNPIKIQKYRTAANSIKLWLMPAS